MVDLPKTLIQVFQGQGWSVRSSEVLAGVGLSFDLVAESAATIVFAEVLRAAQLKDKARELTAQVASAVQRRGSGSKAWEAYLVLVVSDNFSQVLELAQEIQYDLRYCRKVVIAGERVLADDPLQSVRDLLSFLFPLQRTTAVVPVDIRGMLADKLIERNLSIGLVRELVLNFDEADCTCLERFRRFAKGAATQQ